MSELICQAGEWAGVAYSGFLALSTLFQRSEAEMFLPHLCPPLPAVFPGESGEISLVADSEHRSSRCLKGVHFGPKGTVTGLVHGTISTTSMSLIVT